MLTSFESPIHTPRDDMQPQSLHHQMNTTHMQHRLSGEGRIRGGFAASGDGGMTIPQPPPGQLFNGQTRNSNMMGGAKPFDIARSPPNQAAKSMHDP